MKECMRCLEFFKINFSKTPPPLLSFAPSSLSNSKQIYRTTMPLLQPKVYDTIIIGTGLSALTLVKTLLNSNNSLNPLLLESRNRLGGRAHSNTSLNGIVLETGCGALHGFDKNPVAKLCEEYGLVSPT